MQIKSSNVANVIISETKYPTPQICCYDLESHNVSVLREAGFEVYNGTLGPRVRLDPNSASEHLLLPNCDVPSNLHEYDIHIFDLTYQKVVPYEINDHRRVNIFQGNNLYFRCRRPATVFDSRPICGRQILSTLQGLQEKDSIIIVFADKKFEREYEFGRDTGYSSLIEVDKITIDNYSFLPSYIRYSKNKHGKKIIPAFGEGILSNMLEKNISGMEYFIVFDIHDKIEDGKRVYEKGNLPLLFNAEEEVVSFIKMIGQQLILVVPQVAAKGEFLKELIEEILPELKPSIFPDHQKNGWIKEPEYYLPDTLSLLEEKENILSRHNEELSTIDTRINSNYTKYEFLHRILIDTGNELELQIKMFLEWLGLEDIVLADKHLQGERKEEDLNVAINEGLLIMEVKGIGGTSKDSDCAQISKIKARKSKSRNSHDVYALYIVNHQRHLPPLNREHPPFTLNQIKDAEYDERGLLSTWDLFNLYFNIEAGVISKEAARKSLLGYGIIKFIPDLIEELGEVGETYKDGFVIIINNIKKPISCGNVIFVKTEYRYEKIKIIEIKIDDKFVATAIKGDNIGIHVDRKMRVEDKIFIKKNLKLN